MSARPYDARRKALRKAKHEAAWRRLSETLEGQFAANERSTAVVAMLTDTLLTWPYRFARFLSLIFRTKPSIPISVLLSSKAARTASVPTPNAAANERMAPSEG
jgi:hypothetical protein